MNYYYKYDSNTNIDIRYSLSRDYISKVKLSVDIVEDKILVPYSSNNISCKLEKGVYSTIKGRIDNQLFINKDEFNPNEYELLDEEVIYIGNFSTRHYGNFLIDYLCRLWYYLDHKLKLVYVSERLCIEESQAYLNILSFLDIKREDIYRISKPTLCKRIYIPEMSMVHGLYITKDYARIYENIWESVNKYISTEICYDKVYLTRRQLSKKKEIGERYFERFFELNGFKVIAPEKLSFIQQVHLFRNAFEIASIEGTHAHNIIFKGTSNKKYKQIILRKQSEFIPRQIQLNQITNGDTVWIDVYYEPFKGFPISHDRGPFLIIMWNEQIEKFANDNNMIIPHFSRVSYIFDILEYSVKCVAYIIKHSIKRLFIFTKKIVYESKNN